MSLTTNCLACGVKGGDGETWVFFKFNHLASGWLCPACQPKWREHFEKLQKGGL